MKGQQTLYYYTVNKSILTLPIFPIQYYGHRGLDCMVAEFITTSAISAYHHQSCEFESRLWRGLLDKTLCHKVCQCL